MRSKLDSQQRPAPVKVLCVCIGCQAKRLVDPAAVDPGDVPYCEKCFMPMVAESVEVKR